jgi:hypothetical protein
MTRKFLAAMALVVAPLCWPFAASATTMIEARVSGAPSFTLLCTASSGSSCNVGPDHPLVGSALLVTATAQSNAPGTPTAADLSLANTTIVNTSATFTQTVEILAGDTGFLSPSPPRAANLLSTIGGLVAGGSGGTLSYISCFAPSAPLLQVACSPATPGMVSTPPVGTDLSVPGSFFLSSSAVVSTSPGGFYTLAEDLTFQLAPKSEVTFLGTSTTLTPTPVPAPSIGRGLPVLLAVGGLLLGARLLERGKRRRLQFG